MWKKNLEIVMENTSVWTLEQEQLLISWAEKASGYAWLHGRSINYYKYRNLYISIPASIFGYMAGAITLLSKKIYDDDILKGLVGIFGITAGLLTNFQDMFTFKEESEKHKISNLRFLSFFREISCELSMDATHRDDPIDYINIKRLELDKMLEQSPNIPIAIAKQFNSKFKHIALHKPDIVNGIQTIHAFGRNLPKMYYMKKINVYQKIILLKHFSAWKMYVQQNKLERNKNTLVEVVNMSLKDKERMYARYHAPLSTQKKLFRFQNIKIRQNPLQSDIMDIV